MSDTEFHYLRLVFLKSKLKENLGYDDIKSQEIAEDKFEITIFLE